MSIGAWQIVIVVGIIIYVIVRYIKKQNSAIKIQKFSPQEDESQRLKSKNEKKIETSDKENNLGDSLKRLKKMYNDGHLSKVEFEKSKNKLLK